LIGKEAAETRSGSDMRRLGEEVAQSSKKRLLRDQIAQRIRSREKTWLREVVGEKRLVIYVICSVVNAFNAYSHPFSHSLI
jgi:hypothetical protein